MILDDLVHEVRNGVQGAKGALLPHWCSGILRCLNPGQPSCAVWDLLTPQPSGSRLLSLTASPKLRYHNRSHETSPIGDKSGGYLVPNYTESYTPVKTKRHEPVNQCAPR